MPKYKKLPGAEITCVDYSSDMMKSAQEKAEHMGIRNIHFFTGGMWEIFHLRMIPSTLCFP